MKRAGFIQRQPIPFSAQRVRKQDPRVHRSRIKRWQQVSKELVIEDITYWSDGLRVKGWLVYSKKNRRKVPCIIYNRGGMEDFGQINFRQIYNAMAPLAVAGYVVIASQYRGVDGGEGQEEYGGKDLHDVFNLIPCLRQLPFADTKRIGMYGWSRGGMMTYLVLKKARYIKAAVVGGGSADLIASSRYRPKMLANVYRRLIPAQGKRLVAAMKQRSAANWPGKLAPKTPLLLLHGTADWRVRPEESIHLAESLIRLHRPVRLVLFEGGDHGIREHWREVDKQVLNWFDRFLKRGEKLPNTIPHGP